MVHAMILMYSSSPRAGLASPATEVSAPTLTVKVERARRKYELLVEGWKESFGPFGGPSDSSFLNPPHCNTMYCRPYTH
jgi:hypothetical protein